MYIYIYNYRQYYPFLHLLFQKQQNSLIAGLRATNEALPTPMEPAEENKNGTPEQEHESDNKENEQKKVKTANLPRSDSMGSSSGRKFLAPTLSDPSAKADTERIVAAKKKTNRPIVVNKNLTHLNDSETRVPKEVLPNKTNPPKVSHAVHEIRDWWNEQLAYVSSSDED